MDINPDITVCVIASTRQDYLTDFLKSLYETADPVSFEAIVLDNSHNPALQNLLEKEFPETMLYELASDSNPAKNKNHALRLAQGRYVLFCSNKLIFQENCLKHLIDFMDTNPETGIAGPRIIRTGKKIVSTARSYPSIFSMFFENTFSEKQLPVKSGGKNLQKNRQDNHNYETDWITSQCMVVRDEVLEEIGDFDEHFSSSYEDADFCRRARQAGWHIQYIAQACATLQGKAAHRKKANTADTARFLWKKWFGWKRINP